MILLESLLRLLQEEGCSGISSNDLIVNDEENLVRVGFRVFTPEGERTDTFVFVEFPKKGNGAIFLKRDVIRQAIKQANLGVRKGRFLTYDELLELSREVDKERAEAEKSDLPSYCSLVVVDILDNKVVSLNDYLSEFVARKTALTSAETSSETFEDDLDFEFTFEDGKTASLEISLPDSGELTVERSVESYESPYEYMEKKASLDVRGEDLLEKLVSFEQIHPRDEVNLPFSREPNNKQEVEKVLAAFMADLEKTLASYGLKDFTLDYYLTEDNKGVINFASKETVTASKFELRKEGKTYRVATYFLNGLAKLLDLKKFSYKDSSGRVIYSSLATDEQGFLQSLENYLASDGSNARKGKLTIEKIGFEQYRDYFDTCWEVQVKEDTGEAFIVRKTSAHCLHAGGE